MKLPVKLLLCYIGSIVAIFFIINVAGTRIIEQSIEEDMITEYTNTAETIVERFVLKYYESEIEFSDLNSQVKDMANVCNVRLWIVNSKGLFIIDSDRSKVSGASYLQTVDEGHFDAPYHLNVSCKGVFDEPQMEIICPIMYNYAIRGHVLLFVPMSEIQKRAVNYMDVVNICLLVISGVLLIVFGLIYIFTVFPIRRVNRAAQELSKGNYDYKIKTRGHDEFRELSDTIGYMVREIKDVDDYQKKFIANISHDFRSPLTSIRGYAEAMKDGTIPPEAQARYFDIILFETDRLTKLTTNLLELNRMDNKGVRLDITSFDINDIITKTAATFEGICVPRGIGIKLEFSSAETFVDADMGRIQQVLYNLIDNAVKFSKNNSSITVETEEKGSKVMIRVKDSGSGIPKESLNKIWDRFYKGDTSRGKDKKGTGLGLSIVKEIMNAHDENISVISTEGVGTEFSFALPLSEG